MTTSTGLAVQFWFEFASTYSYPAAMRVGRLATDAGVAVEWCPFLLGPIFAQQGWTDSPFNLYPAKGRYMWRDLERIAARDGLAFRRPSRFPRSGLLAARVVCAAAAAPWVPAFVRAVYRANFVHDRDIADVGVVEGCLLEAGIDPAGWIERAGAPATKTDLKARTAEAVRLGIFGAPSFVVDGELFWGNDRLEEAIAWARR